MTPRTKEGRYYIRPTTKELVGQKFGRLLVVGVSQISVKQRRLLVCVCDCGGEKLVASTDLKNGSVSSCGCKNKEHLKNVRWDQGPIKHSHAKRGAMTPTYHSWSAMRCRCNNPNHKNWKDYGGRGISCCERWAKFQNFLTDMGERPDGFTLDRIDPDGNYEPSNCRWADKVTQARNTRQNKQKALAAVSNNLGEVKP
jgi:hypothetical protein